METNTTKKMIFFMVLIITFVVSVLSIATLANFKNSSYEIGPDFFYSYKYKIMQKNDQYYIMSFNGDNNVRLSVFNSTERSIKIVDGIEDKSFNGVVDLDMYDNIFCIVCNDENNNGLSVSQFKVEEDKCIPSKTFKVREQIITSTNFDNFAFHGDYISIIDHEDSHKLVNYSTNSTVARKIVDLTSESTISSIKKDRVGNIFATTQDTNVLLKSDYNSIQELKFNDVGQDINFIGENLFIDSQSKIFDTNSCSDSLNTCCKTNVACTMGNDVLTPCDDNTLLAIDLETKQPTGQYDISHIPQKIFTDTERVVCFTDRVDAIEVELIEGFPKEVDYEEASESMNTFIAKPTGKNYTEDINMLDSWDVFIDRENIIIGERGIIEVVIEYKGSSYKFTSEDAVKFIEPDQISFSFYENLKSGIYNIEIFGACSENGKPLKFKYSVELEDKITPSSSSSESSSSESSSSESSSSSGPTDGKIHSNVYTINTLGGIISGIEPGTTFSELKSDLIYDGTLFAFDKNGKNIKTGKVGTNTEIVLIDSDGKQTDSIKVLIYGDATGNGNIDSGDKDLVVNYILGSYNLEKMEFIALDVNRDNVVNDYDAVFINDHIKGRYKIEQK